MGCGVTPRNAARPYRLSPPFSFHPGFVRAGHHNSVTMVRGTRAIPGYHNVILQATIPTPEFNSHGQTDFAKQLLEFFYKSRSYINLLSHWNTT